MAVECVLTDGTFTSVLLTLGDVLLLAEVIRAVGLAALRATPPPAGHTQYCY